MRPSFDLLDRRRHLVKLWYYQGVDEVEIVQKLERETDDGGAVFFPETQSWRTKRLIVHRDIESIIINDSKRFAAIQGDSQSALDAYISRQEAVYRLAMEKRELDIALRASKDIAKAHGLDPDVAIKPEENLVTLMKAAKANAKPKAIETTIGRDTLGNEMFIVQENGVPVPASD